MKIKKKGKVHPSPPLPPPFPKGDDCLSVLRLLPAVILLLVSSLTPEDKQVLAYLITRSPTITTTTVVSAGIRSSSDPKKKPVALHKAPLFDCECFDCYTSYWFRWDSSPNRELIHQIIEAYEEHLSTGEKEKNSASPKSNGGGGKKKKKEKSRRRRVVEPSGRPEEEPVEPVVASSDEVKPEESPEKLVVETEMLRFPVAAGSRHKGLARKVLPDVMGLFNSRFWRLWNPNA